MNTVNIVAPELPESIAEAVIVKWYKNIGDKIIENEKLIDIETDKIILEIPAPICGVLQDIFKKPGNLIKSNEILGIIDIKVNLNKNNITINKDALNINKDQLDINKDALNINKDALNINKDQLDINKDALNINKDALNINKDELTINTNEVEKLNIKKCKNNIFQKVHYTPKIRRIISKYKFENKNFTKKDLKKIYKKHNIKQYFKKSKNNNKILKIEENIKKQSVPMSYIRRSIAKKLLNAKKKTATATTFNEVNMSSIIKIRKQYGEEFKKKHNIKLGFISFFVQAVVECLKYFPIINAYIENNEIIYNKSYDINIAISTSKGLIAPVLKNANTMSIPKIEHKIKELAQKAENNKLTIEELSGGNFTISNGGIYGSLMSTPIINYPQSAILGMHAIQNRACVVKEKINIFPMMYLALSYNHCLIDGKDAIEFLKRIKYLVEDNRRIMLNI